MLMLIVLIMIMIMFLMIDRGVVTMEIRLILLARMIVMIMMMVLTIMISLYFSPLFVCLYLYIGNIKIVGVFADVFVLLFMVCKGRGRIEVNFISCLRLYLLVASHRESASFPSSVTMIDILISLTRICSLASI